MQLSYRCWTSPEEDAMAQAAHARAKGATKPVSRKEGRDNTLSKTGRNSMGSTLVVRADQSFKSLIKRAAELRGISASDYVRVELKERAAKEIADAERG